MIIENTLVHFNRHQDFEAHSDNILDESIVFVKDRGEILTHGKLYNYGMLDLSEEPVNLSGLTEEFIVASSLGTKVTLEVLDKVDTLIVSVGINKMPGLRRKLILKRTPMNPIINWEGDNNYSENNPLKYENTFYCEYYTTDSTITPIKRGATISINTQTLTIGGSVEVIL